MTKAELLIGKWKRTEPKIPGVLTKEFTRDGKMVEQSDDQNGGLQTGTTTYRLVDNELVFPDAPYTSDDSRLIAERTTLIEKLTEQELITETVIRTRLTPEAATEIAEVRREPVGPILAEVRESRHRAVYLRLKND
jgi:hypothetical protein